MTPKEKAEELLGKFNRKEINVNQFGYSRMQRDFAIICVEEIIKAIDFDWMEVQNLESEHRYWNKVKEEIERL